MSQISRNYDYEFKKINEVGVNSLHIKFMYNNKPWASKWMPIDGVEAINNVIKHLTELKNSITE